MNLAVKIVSSAKGIKMLKISVLFAQENLALAFSLLRQGSA
jgi:hypothetical protein